jgi:hypothetical protein
MTYLQRIFLKKVVFLGMVLATAIFLAGPLIRIFVYNLTLNILIMSCFGIGVVLGFYQLWRLYKEQQWLDRCEQGTEQFPNAPKAYILAPLMIILNDPQYQNGLPTLTAQSVLSSVDARLDEGRNVNRYLMGLLVFLGLLGTFWGLSETIGAIAGVINNLNPEGAEATQAFNQLRQGLQSPLNGMGIAFSSSLFGLAGSLILGFLDLQMRRASAGFYQNLEERLITITRYSMAAEKSSQYNGPAYSLSLLEQAVEGMTSLQTHLRRSEDNRLNLVKTVQGLSEKLTQMAEQMVAHQAIIKTITHNQLDLQEGFKQWLQQHQLATQGETVHLRSMDATMSKILEETIEGRNRLTQELRQEIRVIARTLSAIANGQEVAA